MRKLAQTTAIANVAVVATGLVVLAVLPEEEKPAPPRTRVTAPALPSAELPPAIKATAESARKAGANELGLVPILMYHRIRHERVSSIDRTPAQLRAELEKLAKQGYVPVTAREFVTGEINIPAGTHPVVLTFDDGSPTHFALDPAGVPLPDTAVGVIMDVAARYPAFRPVATFWVNGKPFGLTDEGRQKTAITWLRDHGFEVSNHTYGHQDLRRMKNKGVAEQIVRQERLLRRLGVPESATLALPYGSRPKKLSVAMSGKWDGTAYGFEGVFLAGAEPSVSPYAKGYDRRAIQRIQSNGTKGDCAKWCSTYWLEWLEKQPGERYTADGDPDSVSLPKRLEGEIGAKRGKTIIAY